MRNKFDVNDTRLPVTLLTGFLGESVQPPIYVPFLNRVSGTGGLMFRAW